MSPQPPSDETLMAFADGELAGNEARALEALIATDPQLAARVEMFRETARRLSDLSQAQDATVPDALITRVRVLAAEAAEQQAAAGAALPIELASHRAAQRATAPGRPVWLMPLAASVLLALGLGGGYLMGQGATGPEDSPLAVLDSAELDQALRGSRTGDRLDFPGGGDVSIIASFRDGEGRLCREFEVDRPERQTIVSVACHEATGGWSTQLAILAAPGDATGYAPASSLEVLDAYLGAVAAGPPLSVDEEITALDGLD